MKMKLTLSPSGTSNTHIRQIHILKGHLPLPLRIF
jgi:hypothetical protein